MIFSVRGACGLHPLGVKRRLTPARRQAALVIVAHGGIAAGY